MKKANMPAPKTSTKKAPAIKQSAAKPNTKSSSKPKPRKAQGQLELLPIVERLTQNADKLAQAADRLAQAAERLTEATARSQTRRQGESLERRQLSAYPTVSGEDAAVAEGTGEASNRTNPADDETLSPDEPTIHR